MNLHVHELNRRKLNVAKMLDQLSPVAPARVRVVLLPIGQIKRVRFLSFVERLQPENVVRLGEGVLRKFEVYLDAQAVWRRMDEIAAGKGRFESAIY